MRFDEMGNMNGITLIACGSIRERNEAVQWKKRICPSGEEGKRPAGQREENGGKLKHEA